MNEETINKLIDAKATPTEAAFVLMAFGLGALVLEKEPKEKAVLIPALIIELIKNGELKVSMGALEAISPPVFLEAPRISSETVCFIVCAEGMTGSIVATAVTNLLKIAKHWNLSQFSTPVESISKIGIDIPQNIKDGIEENIEDIYESMTKTGKYPY